MSPTGLDSSPRDALGKQIKTEAFVFWVVSLNSYIFACLHTDLLVAQEEEGFTTTRKMCCGGVSLKKRFLSFRAEGS